jgi:hypothetical protein
MAGQQFYFLIWIQPLLRGGGNRCAVAVGVCGASLRQAYRKLLPLLHSLVRERNPLAFTRTRSVTRLLSRSANNKDNGSTLCVELRSLRRASRLSPQTTPSPRKAARKDDGSTLRVELGSLRRQPDGWLRQTPPFVRQTPGQTRLLSRSANIKDNESAIGVCSVQAGLLVIVERKQLQ